MKTRMQRGERVVGVGAAHAGTGTMAFVLIAAAMTGIAGCAAPRAEERVGARVEPAAHQAATSLAPEGVGTPAMAPQVGAAGVIAGEGEVQGPWIGTAAARIVDTRLLAHRPDVLDVPSSRQRAVREILPPHERPSHGLPAPAEPAALHVPAPILEESRSEPLALFPGPAQTEWRPPDPNLAVGPSHIVATVNMALTIHDKATGELQFAVPLNNYGSPGLFEGQGAEWFVFDPKCVYDHVSQRFVVIALETYSAPVFGAWVNIAISDDADPHGVWYTYRTDVAQGSTWWDYPSLGYDGVAWYVTANRIGGGGAGIRVFRKASMLSGGPAQFSTFNVSVFTTQAATHFGENQAGGGAGYIAALSGNQLQVFAVTNPGSSPAVVGTSVAVPNYGGPAGISTPNGAIENLTSNWLMNAAWRDGMLFATHAALQGAAWYQVATNGWPASGQQPTLVQSGVVNPNLVGVGSIGNAFPAITVNAAGDVGIVMNVGSSTMNPSVAVAARRASDPPGTFGRVRVVRTGTSPEGGRWGDYSGIAVDPVDGLTFWGISEYKDVDPDNPAPGNARWKNWITSFAATPPSEPFASVDDAGVVASGSTRSIDVLSNDFVPAAQTAVIDSFDATSAAGGTISRVSGGPGGRDLLRYVAPAAGAAGLDRFVEDAFTYRLRTSAGAEATGTVRASVVDASRFLFAGALRSTTTPGWRVRYYAFSQPESFPAFEQLTPYAEETAVDIAFGSGLGAVLSSGRSDDVGFVAEGWFNVASEQLYRFTLGASEGAKLWVGGQLVIDNRGPNSSILDRIGFVGLRPGWHPIRVQYYERYERAGLNFSSTPAISVVRAQGCDSVDVNRDGSIFDPADVDAFLSVFAEGPCIPADATCNDIDFNNDGSTFDPCDIDAFLLSFSEGPCTACST